jgi:hypothetical protein
MPTPATAPSLSRLHAAFLTILPRIELHARISFRGLRCPQRRDDAVRETVAVAWKWFARLVERGKDPLSFPTALAAYAARAVKCGRRVCGQEHVKDALSAVAQQRHGFTVEPLPHSTASTHEERYGHVDGQRRQDALEERLRDNTQTPVPEQVAFRLDFPAWRKTHARRTREILDRMMAGERTSDLSQRFGLSPARISQMRRELHNDWHHFLGNDAP